MAIQRDKIIANAEKLVAKGKIEPAIKEYEQLLDDNPNDVNTLNRIGDLWVRINRTEEAVKTFGAIAHHYSKDGFFLKAIAIYKKINKLDPSKLDVYAKLADLYAKQGLATEAKSQYQVLADYYLKHGDPANALATYRKIVELDPNDMKVHVKLADLFSQNNQTAEALKEYDRVGRMLLKRGMLDEAVQVFKKALKIDAKNIELVESLVTALVEAKDLNNAQSIVETALGTNPNHPRLVAGWARILIAKGDVSSAKSGLEAAIASHPDETAPREVMGELYLRQNNADKALEMLGPVAENALKKGEKNAAVDGLNRILKIDKSHTPTLEKLVAIYQRVNEETNILASMNSLAEAHIAKGQYQQASSVLEKLIQREPQNAQHKTKLQFVMSQTGGAAPTPPPRPKPEMVMEVEEPMPDLELDEAPAVAVDLDTAPIELGMDEQQNVAPPPRMEERGPAIDVEPASDDLDFITEHLTEAEVFAKYGLIEKATEHLRAVIERSPRHLPAHEKLYKVLLDEGQTDEARAAAMQYVGFLQEDNNREAIVAVKNDFTAHGATISIPGAEVEPEMSMAELDAEPPLPQMEEAPAVEVEEEISIEEPAEEEVSIEVSAEEEQPALSFDDAPAASQAFFGTEAEKTPEPEPELEMEAAPEPEPEPEPEPVAPPPPPPPPAATLRADELQSELLSALPDDADFEPTPPPPPPVEEPPPPPPAPVLTTAQEENLFADEDNFFDLASELESELADETETISLAEEEQSLEEIFKEFKKGVEQQLDSEDYDTHYNLGIAYKEMGLIDEAIGEFQLASKDPKRAVECASMLGLCFTQKGMPQLAIKWYRKGLELPEITEEEQLGMLYDLGVAYMDTDDTENAQKTFMEVYGLNTGYRDIATRIKQLEDARK